MSSDLSLPQNPTLKDYQSYVAMMVKQRGFDNGTQSDLFLLLLEECGELAKASRKNSHIKTDVQHCVERDYRADLEAADVLIYLLQICNLQGIDLEKAFREKEELNKKRVWK